MSWSYLILAALKMALSLTTYLRERDLIKAGQDKEIANAALSVLEATRYGKELRVKVASLTDEDADDLWSRMLER